MTDRQHYLPFQRVKNYNVAIKVASSKKITEQADEPYIQHEIGNLITYACICVYLHAWREKKQRERRCNIK